VIAASFLSCLLDCHVKQSSRESLNIDLWSNQRATVAPQPGWQGLGEPGRRPWYRFDSQLWW